MPVDAFNLAVQSQQRSGGCLVVAACAPMPILRYSNVRSLLLSRSQYSKEIRLRGQSSPQPATFATSEQWAADIEMQISAGRGKEMHFEVDAERAVLHLIK